MKIFTLSLVLLCGCVSYTSHVKLPDGGELALPKDAKGDLLIFTREFTDAIGRTNRITLLLSNYTFRMNPAVIDAKTAHDVQLFQAGANAAAQLIGAIPK